MSIRIKIRQDILYLVKDVFKDIIQEADSPEGADVAYKVVRKCNEHLSRIEGRKRNADD